MNPHIWQFWMGQFLIAVVLAFLLMLTFMPKDNEVRKDMIAWVIFFILIEITVIGLILTFSPL